MVKDEGATVFTSTRSTSRKLRSFTIVLALLALDITVAAAGPDERTGPKIDSKLMALHDEYVATKAARGTSVPFTSKNRLARVVDDHVVIDAVANGDTATLQAALSALGMRHMAVFGRVVSGELPIAAIPALPGVASLRFARVVVSRHRAGPVASQGDQAIHADIARARFGVTGAGVKVGAVSVSFDCAGRADADIASGELSPVQVLSDSCPGDDEGRAMLQIVHDVAPGASLAFATGQGGGANLAGSILALGANGARVIFDDLAYYTEPMFQDGIVSQAIDQVVAQGATYFSAAGNDARNSYQNPFVAGTVFAAGQIPSTISAPFFFGGTAHNFGTANAPDYFQRVTIPHLSTISIALQWDSPFFSAGGPGSSNDVDVYLLSADASTVVAGSTNDNLGDDAVEIFEFTNFGATADFNLMIVNFRGPSPGFIKYIQFGDANVAVKEFDTASGTVFAQPNAAGAIAVGAADFVDTPRFGVSPPMLESYSSAGGVPILFDVDGNRLVNPEIRQKPEIIAPDGVSTAVSGFSSFFGTSAAVPHAAGVAALLLQQQPSLAPISIVRALERTAIDMGAPGFDFDTGFGLIQADAAGDLVSALQPLAAAILPSSRSVEVQGTATAFATILNGGSSPAVAVAPTLATSLPATFSYQTTNPNTNQPTGAPNTPVDIPAGGGQTYVISVTPSGEFGPTDVQFSFAGANTLSVPPLTGVNTLLLSASSSPVPDIIAVAASGPPNNGIVTIPGALGAGAFAVASVDVGATSAITVTADTGGTALPVLLALCQSDPATGQCINPAVPTSSVTLPISGGQTPTFAIFVQGTGVVPLAPGTNRVFVRFKDANGMTRGSTSVAVMTR